jgi:EmrB/QacA subfamily drug resistance transporter
MGLRSWQADGETVHRRRWITLVVLGISLIVIVIDNSILNVALPTLAKSRAQGGIGASESSLQWIVDGYTIVFAGLLLTAGSLGDRFGRYRGLTLGLIVFAGASAGASMAGSPVVLVAWRCAMGIGGAFIMPSTLSIVTNVFTDEQERGRAIGVWAGLSAVGIAVGPLTGGFLLRHFWWGSVLLVNVPIVVLALVAGVFLVPDSKDPSKSAIDPLGSVLSTAGLAALLWGVIDAPNHGWTSVPTLVALAAGVLLLLGFVLWERHVEHPMLDLAFFRDRRFSAASAAVTLTFLALLGLVFLLTQYLQSVLGYTPLQTGALFVPMSLVIVVAAPASARLVEWIGTKVVVAAGLLVVAGSMLLQLLFRVDSGVGIVIATTTVLALGMANVMAPATESIMGSLPPARAGVGSAVNDTTREVGGAIGVALFGSVLSAQYRAPVQDALRRAHAPRGVTRAAGSSIQAALEISRRVPGRRGTLLAGLARSSFVDGLHQAAIMAAAIAVVAAVAVVVWLPARSAAAQGDHGGERDDQELEGAGAAVAAGG